MPRKKKRVIHPHLRMTILDMFCEGYKRKTREFSAEILKAAYDLKTLEDQVGIKIKNPRKKVNVV